LSADFEKNETTMRCLVSGSERGKFENTLLNRHKGAEDAFTGNNGLHMRASLEEGRV
jgi:hypothetical protein